VLLEGIPSVFFTSTLDEGERSASGASRFSPGTKISEDWVEPKVGLHEVKEKFALEHATKSQRVSMGIVLLFL
jgi:hypothetical protein